MNVEKKTCSLQSNEFLQGFKAEWKEVSRRAVFEKLGQTSDLQYMFRAYYLKNAKTITITTTTTKLRDMTISWKLKREKTDMVTKDRHARTDLA